MRANSAATASDALDLTDEALGLIDTLRSECGGLEKRCVTLETQLREYDADVRALLDLVPTALIVTDTTGIILDANRAAATLLGRSTPRLKHELLLHFFDDRAAFTQVVKSLSMAVTSAPAKVALKLRPRERAPFHAEISFARDPRQGELRWLWFIGRITEPQMQPDKPGRPLTEPSPRHPDES